MMMKMKLEMRKLKKSLKSAIQALISQELKSSFPLTVRREQT
jgi:hypothetical protein